MALYRAPDRALDIHTEADLTKAEIGDAWYNYDERYLKIKIHRSSARGAAWTVGGTTINVGTAMTGNPSGAGTLLAGIIWGGRNAYAYVTDGGENQSDEYDGTAWTAGPDLPYMVWENIAGIGGFGMAVKLATKNLKENIEHIKSLETHLINQLNEKNIDYKINGSDGVPGVLNMTYPNIDGQSLVMQLDIAGIGISYGAACASGTAKPPGVLLETGISPKQAKCSVRISFGKSNNIQDIDIIIDKMKLIISRLKKEPIFV